jgi:hypothetical protein
VHDTHRISPCMKLRSRPRPSTRVRRISDDSEPLV